jgi:hypothetical protein
MYENLWIQKIRKPFEYEASPASAAAARSMSITHPDHESRRRRIMERGTTSNTSSERDEQRFLSSFSKQLAEALRSKEEEEVKERERLRTASASGNSSRSRLSITEDATAHWERLRSTYVELCHDDPIISGGDVDCRRLAKALIPKPNKTNNNVPSNAKRNATALALSSRLVDGIFQATSRAVERARTTTVQLTNDSSGDDDGAMIESMFGPSKTTTSEGYAQIAFAIFVEGPYRCIQQAENIDIFSKFLGSFQPPSTVPNHNNLAADEKERLMDEATSMIEKGMETMGVQSNIDNHQISSTNKHDDTSSSSSDFFLPNATNDNDNDSMNEIYADESDPDDYDYDYATNDNPCSSTPNIQPILGENLRSASTDGYDDYCDMSFDPHQLSEPSQGNQTCEGACKSIYYLLSSLSYSNLAFGSLSSRTWSEWGMSETLADLSFIMLLEITNREHRGNEAQPNSFFHQKPNDHDDSMNIAALWDRPLFALRDRALDKNHGHDALPSYLQLLIALLSHSEHETTTLSSQYVQPSSRNSLPPTAIVGLSSLGAMCSSKEMLNTASGRTCATTVWSVCPRDEMKKAIVASLHSLARIVEGVRQRSVFANSGSVKWDHDESNQGRNSWIRTVACVIPMIEYLTNVQARFDFQPVFEGVGSRNNATLAESDAKALSESGFFREMLFMFTSTNNENDISNTAIPNAKEVVRMQLLRTIFTLSIQSPERLGRYALGAPDFANEVHSSTFLDSHLVDAVLWLSIGSYLLEDNNSGQSNQPRLKLRKGSSLNSTAPPKETKSLAERSITGFAAMCETTKITLEYLKKFVQSSVSGDLNDEQKGEFDACVGELGSISRFSSCLSNCSSITKIWLGSMTNSDGASTIAREQIAQLKSTLASLPSLSDEATETCHRLGHKKDDEECTARDDDNDDANPKVLAMKQFRKEYKSIVGSVWSSVKLISLALESQQGPSLSKTD